MASKTPFTDMAKKILENAQILDAYVSKNNLPVPTFDETGPFALPPDPAVGMAKMAIQDTLSDMQMLVAGPPEWFGLFLIPAYHDLGVLSVLNQFSFWDAVPLNGTASVAEISKTVGLSPELVTRLLRVSMSKNFFAETAPGSGVVRHTIFTAHLVKAPAWRDWMGHCLEEVAPLSLYLGEYLKKKGESSEPNQSACADYWFPDHPEYPNAFTFFANDGEGEKKGWRAKRFANAMKCIADDPNMRIDMMLALFDWDSLGEGTIVDIGGSRGHISFEILSKHPKLKAIVQDLPSVETEFDPPESLKSRASFQVHDFYTPEPVKYAKVYFMKHILHDWSDKYASIILQNIIPAMGPDSKILIMEFIVPPAGTVPLTAQRVITGLDMQMLVAAQSQERSPEDWHKLIAKASDKLKIKTIHTQPGLPIGIVEVVIA